MCLSVFAQYTKLWLYSIDCFSQIGIKNESLNNWKKINKCFGFESDLKVEMPLDLNNRDFCSCSVKTGGDCYLNCYFVFDDHHIIFVEPDKLKLGKAVVKIIAHVLFVEVI